MFKFLKFYIISSLSCMVSSIFFLSVSVKLTDLAIKQPNYSIFAPINTSLAFICPLFDIKNKKTSAWKNNCEYIWFVFYRGNSVASAAVLKSK